MKNKTKTRFCIGSISCLMLLGLITTVACQNSGGSKVQQAVKDYSDVRTEVVEESNLSIRMLSKVDNQDGTVSITYSYTFTPASTTRKELVGSIAFASETSENVNNYLSFSINNDAQTFTITKLRDFSTQIIFTLTSRADPSIHASITVDCKQRVELEPLDSIVDYTDMSLTPEEIIDSLRDDTLTFTSDYTIELEEGVDFEVDFEVGCFCVRGVYNGGVIIDKTFPVDFMSFDEVTDEISMETINENVVPQIVSNKYLSEDEIQHFESSTLTTSSTFIAFTRFSLAFPRLYSAVTTSSFGFLPNL